MISLDEAIRIAEKYVNDKFKRRRIVVDAYTEYVDWWSFGFKEKDGDPVFIDSVRVFKDTGEAEQWDFWRNIKQYSPLVVNKTVHL